MKNLENWKKFNENLNPEIFGGWDDSTISELDRTAEELYKNVTTGFKKRIQDVKSFFNKFKRKETEPEINASTPPTETGMVLHGKCGKESKKNEITFINFIEQNLNVLKWSDINATQVLLNFADNNIKNDRSLEEIQDICTKLNNLMIRNK